jgi:ABC-type polysaccharide/polyol phosphate export permease
MPYPAVSDIVDSLKRADLWVFMGWHDVRQRYRRSTLGPFWITLATMIFIGLMTVVYSALLRQDVYDFLPFVAAGMVIWTMISGCLTEGTNVFISAAAVIRQVPAPLPVHVFRLLWQQVIFFLHNVVVIVLVIIVLQLPVNAATFLVIPGFLVLVLNLGWIVLALGSLGARYRDVPTIVQSFTPGLFIVTPVMWPMTILPPERRWVAAVNPFTYFIDLVRLPMLGQVPDPSTWGVCLLIAGAGWLLAIRVYKRARGQIAYWV